MKNLTRAAEASLITVAAASRRLALLEHQLKTTLFERHSRGLDLTPAGERLKVHSGEIDLAVIGHLAGMAD
jgi:DNA-binding transcriptional LysR family regulator